MGAAATFAYRAAPAFWDQYSRELKREVARPPHVPDPARWPDTGLHAAWLGHSTVLLKVDGLTILTDPVLREYCGIWLGPVTLGLKRLVAPALPRERLPRIDLVLLSHAHFDHWDTPTLRSLESGETEVIAAARTSDLLRAGRYRRVHELRWGEEARVGPASIRAFEVNHWGARMRSDTYRGYNGYVIQTERHRVVFGGDTAATDSFQALRGRRPVQLAVMPIGAYNPWIRAHCTPEQAVRMADDCGADCILPIHHQTFQLSREPRQEPMERLLAAAGSSGRVALQEIGQEWRLS